MLVGIAGGKQHGKDTVGEMIRLITGSRDMSDEEVILALEGHALLYGFTPKFEIKKYATKLKQMVCALLGCSMFDLETDEFKNKTLWKKYIPVITEKTLIDFDEFFEHTANHGEFYSEKDAENYIKEYESDLDSEFEEIITSRIDISYITPRYLMQTIGTEWGRRLIHPDIWVNTTFNSYHRRCNWIITDVRFYNEVKAIRDREGLLFKVINPKIESNDSHASENGLNGFNEYDEIIVNDGSLQDLLKKVKQICKKYELV